MEALGELGSLEHTLLDHSPAITPPHVSRGMFITKHVVHQEKHRDERILIGTAEAGMESRCQVYNVLVAGALLAAEHS